MKARQVAPAAVVLVLAGGLATAQQPVFRSIADVIALDVLVLDRNRSVAGLAATDFELLDNGVPQTILDASREWMPLDVTLAIDTSASIHGRLLDSLVRAVNTVRERLREGDRLTVLTFNARIREHIALAPATLAPPLALDPAHAKGPTSLNDVIAVAMASPPDLDRRRMAIVFTDGVDTISFLDEAAVLDVARHSRTALFVVATRPLIMRLPAPPPKRGSPPQRPVPPPPEKFFEALADITGGRVQMVAHVPAIRMVTNGSVMRFVPGGDERLLDAPFLRALEDFRTSYVLRYAPTGVVREGWHDISVRVTKRGRYQVRTRRGYSIGG